VIDLAFLASNNGSSFRAIVAAIEAGELAATPRLVVSNKRDAPALDFARAHGIAAMCIPTVPDPVAADHRLASALAHVGAQVVVLSGYLRKLGPTVLGAWQGRILNIHPALLPRFGGQGMYGRKVHEAVLAAGVAVSGASVHLVDEVYDHGPVLARREVPVLAGDDARSLEARVMAAEPGLFIETLQRIADGRLELAGLARPR
jgi:phosphoribosylglycinamide formyltransferase-1